MKGKTMDALKNFREKDFIEQTKLLSEIEKEKKTDAVPDLFDLHETPLNDQAVDSMVTHTLRSLLAQSEEATVRGIRSGKPKAEALSIHMAGECRFLAAGPVLMELVGKEKDPAILFEILSALSKIKTPESLEFFRKNTRHQEPAIASLCVETLGLWEDIASLPLFGKIIEEGEGDDRYEECDLLTWSAIKAMSTLRSDEALAFLVSKIHHRSPAARRLIHQALVDKGRAAIPFLAHPFLEDDVDAKIHAAQLLGLIPDRKAGEALAAALVSGAADDPNIKYNIYESLGKVPFVKGIECLMAGLSEKDDLVLLAVISTLNKRFNARAIEKIAELITCGDAQGEKIATAIVVSKSLNIFEALHANKSAFDKLLAAIPKTKDPVVITAFRSKLKSMKTGEAAPEAAKLSSPFAGTGLRILAVDDSRLMLFFYRTAASKVGFNITTAINGSEALDILEKGEEFDLIVTDLNMPIMDGIEFTRKVRARSDMGKIKIIMATTESKQSQVDLARKVGVDDFIQKPFTEEVFQKKIQALLSGS